MPNGLGFFDFVLSLGGIINAAFAAVVQALVFVVNLLLNITIFLLNVVFAIAQFLVALGARLVRFLTGLWENVIKKGLHGLARLYARFQAWVQKWLGPLLRWVRRIREWIDRHVMPHVIRILNIIQRIRRVLFLLRIFNIGFAKRLDAFLNRLQARIADVFLRIRGHLVEIANILNLILDPQLLINSQIIGGSILKYLGAVKRALGLGADRPLTPDEEKDVQRDATRFRRDGEDARQKERADVGLTEERREFLGAFRREWTEITGVEAPPLDKRR